MNLNAIPPGINPPHDFNVVIEIPGGPAGGQPVKYEIDKDSGALVVDRIVNVPMFYPNNYGFVPNTLHEDGDPVDVMVRTEVTLVPGSVIRCRLVGVLKMEDDGGMDDKLIALPIEKVDPFQAEIRELQDLPVRHRDRIWHFFEHYKSLEKGKWVRVIGWGDRAEAEAILLASIARGKQVKLVAE
jgi:inorganic pyrophosphatase